MREDIQIKPVPMEPSIVFIKSVIFSKYFTARRYASAVLAVILCVSVIRRYCAKTAKCRITEITLHDSPETLVF